MALCAGIKRDGTRCTQSVFGTAEFCHHHDPRRAEERKRQASRAGRSRVNRVIQQLYNQLDDVAQKVLDGTIKPYPGMVFGQLVNCRINLMRFEKDLGEQEEVIERLERLEEVASQARSGRSGRWGA